MSLITAIIVTDTIGISIASYLVYKRKKRETPVCVIGGHCSEVLESRFNRLFGIHNDIMGLGFYLAVGTLMLLMKLEIGPIDLWITAFKFAAGTGAIMALALLYIQWKVLLTWCFWCIVSNLNTLAMALATWTLFK